MYFSEFLKEWLAQDAKRSQGDIARTLGISRQFVSQYVQGKCKPKFETGYLFMYKLGASEEQRMKFVNDAFKQNHSHPGSDHVAKMAMADIDKVHNTVNAHAQDPNHTIAPLNITTPKGAVAEPKLLPIYNVVNGTTVVIGYMQDSLR